MTFKVLITRPIPEIGIRMLSGRFDTVVLGGPYEDLTRRLQGALPRADAVVTLLPDRIDDALLGTAPGLRIIANYAVGYNNIDVAAAGRRGVMVTHTPGVLTRATAEIAFALMICLTRRILEADADLRAGRFQGWDPLGWVGRELKGMTVGIIGMGRIGQDFAAKCRAFDMSVLYCNRRRLPEQVTAPLRAEYCSMDRLLARSDVLSLHAPLTGETRHIIDAAALERMKPGALIINTSRGPLIDEAALAEALSAGRVAGAGLDVYEFEPAVSASLIGMKNVVLLPHIGSATHTARDGMATIVAENVIAALSDRRPPNLVPEQADLFE